MNDSRALQGNAAPATCLRAMNEAESTAIIPAERIHRAILLIRGQKVMLDRDLAALYGVTTFNLNKAVKRNLQRFPADFMFQLTAEEAGALVFQFGISKGRGGTRYRPYAFTEQGVAMLSSVLRSERAIQVNVAIMRAFVGLRQTLAAHGELAAKLAELERRIEKHDESIRTLFEAIRQLMAPPPETPKRQIGFQVREARAIYRVRPRR